MKILIVSSTEDKASINLKEELLNKYQFEKIKEDLTEIKVNNSLNQIFLREISKTHIFSQEEDILKEEYQQVIFLSRHSTLSQIKPKCMTVHAIGNWMAADLGGKEKTIVKTDPILIRKLLLNLKENKPKEIKEYEVKQEATHHGPYLNVSTIFYEIGSSIEDWENKEVSKYMIEILIKTIKDYDRESTKKENEWVEVVGFGGSHYCTKFNRLTFDRQNKYCFGHVVASYAEKEVIENKEILNQAKIKSNSEKIINQDDL